jgi:hypothetical protein
VFGTGTATMKTVPSVVADGPAGPDVDCILNRVVADNNVMFDQSMSYTTELKTQVEAGGDVKSVVCLEPLRKMLGTSGLKCADVSLWMEYALVTQPNTRTEKDFRFVTRQEGDNFRWYRQALNLHPSPCPSPLDP